MKQFRQGLRRAPFNLGGESERLDLGQTGMKLDTFGTADSAHVFCKGRGRPTYLFKEGVSKQATGRWSIRERKRSQKRGNYLF